MSCERNSHSVANEKCQWETHRLCYSWVIQVMLEKLWDVLNMFKISKLLTKVHIATDIFLLKVKLAKSRYES